MALKSTREQLTKLLEGLPAEALEDIARYADYWRYKLARQKPSAPKSTKRKKHPAAGIWADSKKILRTQVFTPLNSAT